MISTAVLLIVVWTGHPTQRLPEPDLAACMRSEIAINAAARDRFGTDQKEVRAWCETPKHPELMS
jgi:hypothetical protein